MQWKNVGEIPGFPFDTYAELQQAVSSRKANIGVDALIAANWADRCLGGASKGVVSGLSLLLVVAAFVSMIAAFWLKNYWLLAAIPLQMVAFYFSHPASSIRKWVTIAGIASVLVFADLVLNGLPTAALLLAYAGLTFAAVRAAGFITNSAFRKALLADEKLFLAAFANRACTI